MSGKTGREFMREAGADLDCWVEAMALNAAQNGYVVEREWLRSWLSDYADAVLKAKPPPIIQEEQP